MLRAGVIVADKYRLERVLGRGGMGTVIEARHIQLGTSVALKFLHRSIVETETVMERFLREARATAALRSEHVCRVFDVGSFEGAPYLVMELLEGIDLERVLRRERRLSPREACGYVIQACVGVADAHAAQIVHRDLKPGNLFLMARSDGSPLVKVLDFGIAKAPHEAELGLTKTHAVLGSPAYMSLEQLRSSRLVDARSDIWSLGVILYELVAGRRPFHGEGVADLALRIAMEPTPLLPRGPHELDEIIARCLALEPAERFPNVGELAQALSPFADEPSRRLAASLARATRTAPALGSVPPPALGSSPAVVVPPALGGLPSPALGSSPSVVLPSESSSTTVGSAPPVVMTLTALAPDERPSQSSVELATTMQTSGSGAIEVEAAAPPHARPEAEPPRSRPRSRLGVVLAMAAAAGGLALALSRTVSTEGGDAPAAEPEALAPAAEPEAPVAVPPAPPPAPLIPAAPEAGSVAREAARAVAPAETVMLRFAIEPPGAAIELDGVFVPTRQIKVHRDGAAHALRITAPGFAPHTGEVRFDESQRLVVRLKRSPRRIPAATARPLDAVSGQRRIESRSPYE